ncbi:MAG: hypothetical protein IJB32_05455 [Clostridia bacterium]|nr:hypothetical protein [Clostridia bacterium]
MKIIDKINEQRAQKYWNKQGKKDMFTFVHRYLRLHNELLADRDYQSMYDYFRSTLMESLKTDLKNEKLNDWKLGELVDDFADDFNNNEPELVNKYKEVVEELYKAWKENPNEVKELGF